MAIIDRFPEIRDQSARLDPSWRERRWNPRLKNGLDVSCPKPTSESALALLVVARSREEDLVARHRLDRSARSLTALRYSFRRLLRQARDDALKEKAEAEERRSA